MQQAAAEQLEAQQAAAAAGEQPVTVGTRAKEEPRVYLFFSVNGSQRFCGMCTMESAVDYESSVGVWYSAGKWKGEFRVKWVRSCCVDVDAGVGAVDVDAGVGADVVVGGADSDAGVAVDVYVGISVAVMSILIKCRCYSC